MKSIRIIIDLYWQKQTTVKIENSRIDEVAICGVEVCNDKANSP